MLATDLNRRLVHTTRPVPIVHICLGEILNVSGEWTIPSEASALHVQWLEDPLLNEVAEVVSAFLLYDLSRQPVGPIVFEKLGPKLVDRLEVRSCPRKFAPCDLRPTVLAHPETALLLETGAVTQDVSYSSVTQRGSMLELRKEIGDCAVPL